MKKKTGTREWSAVSKNCRGGCAHGCVYCYARFNALRWGKIQTGAQFANETPRPWAKVRKYSGVVMFPTEHDITPENCEPCLELLRELLHAGNEVLLVSKPHREVIERIVRETDARWLERLAFRFTIGAMDDSVLAAWEPNAPDLKERIECLRRVADVGYRTSVSCEPLLDPSRAAELVEFLAPDVTDDSPNGGIWIGKLNHARARCAWYLADHPEFEDTLAALEGFQTGAAVRRVYEEVMALPLSERTVVRWKDSYRQALERLDLIPRRTA